MADGSYGQPAAAEPVEAVKPDIENLRRMFSDAASLTADARRHAQTDRDYFDGIQWTQAEKAVLAQRKQPDNVFNRVRPAIEGTLGVIDQGQTDPRAYPRNPDDEPKADTATKVLRYMDDHARLDRTFMDCAEQYYVEGTCAVITELDDDGEVIPTQIRWEEFFYDPRSRKKDFSDSRYFAIAKWRYADEVAAEFPDSKGEIDACISAGGLTADDTLRDRPSDSGNTIAWVDKNKKRLMVVELYHLESREWRRCVFIASMVLDYGPSAYMRAKGGTRCPIEAASCYVDRENNRYGKVRDMRGPQDEINKRRSKALHFLSVAQIEVAFPEAIEVDPATAREEASRPDGVIPYGWKRVQVGDIVQGQVALLQEAKAEIERMGPNPAILGRQGESQSGRANLVRQQAGLTELAPTLSVFDDFKLRVYRQMWECARQFWRAPKWIRITDEDTSKPQFVGLNQPTGAIDMQTGQPQLDNSMAEMDVDIIVESTPDTATVQQEQFLALVDLSKSGVQFPPDILLQFSTIPDKQRIIEKLQERSQQPDPMREIAQAGAVAEVQKTQSETALNQAKAQSEAIKPEVEAVRAFQTGHQLGMPPQGGSGDFPPS